MDAVILIEKARLAGLSISVADGKLRVDGRENAATAALVKQLGQSKQSIIDFLSGAQPAKAIVRPQPAITQEPPAVAPPPVQPLPVEAGPVDELESNEWSVNGIPTFREAMAIQQEMVAQHGPGTTACGMDRETRTFYVRYLADMDTFRPQFSSMAVKAYAAVEEGE